MEKIRLTLIGFGGMGQIYAKMIFAGMVYGLQQRKEMERNR